MGRMIGGYLRFYGFNLDFAPVADVDSNPANPVIGRRAYSTDAQQTAQMVAAAVEGFHEAGMLCTVKHFPGHGDTGQDSHYGTATSYKTWEEMKAMEMLPFEAGIAAGVDVVMTAHITTPNATTDGLPGIAVLHDDNRAAARRIGLSGRDRNRCTGNECHQKPLYAGGIGCGSTSSRCGCVADAQ